VSNIFAIKRSVFIRYSVFLIPKHDVSRLPFLVFDQKLSNEFPNYRLFGEREKSSANRSKFL